MSRFRPGRLLAPEGVLTEAEAAARMLALIRAHHEEQTLLERDAAERRRRGVTVRELASEYLHWLEDVKGAKPSTLRDHRSLAWSGLPSAQRRLSRFDHGRAR